MKRSLNPCHRWRRSLALLAASALPAADRTGVEDHLGACPRCREFFAQMQSVTASLAEWPNARADLQPRPAAQERWASAIRAAASQKVAHPLRPAAAFHEWWHDVIWSSRRVWAGLAAVWVLILAGHLSLREHPPALTARVEHPSREMIMAYRDQQAILSELLADHAAPPDADRPKTFVPKPRTENARISFV